MPSVEDVHDFMLKRAESSPYRQAVLLELRFAEISKMMRMASKVGDGECVELFLSAVRFAMALWATTHAVDYVRLGTDILVYMECASPALKTAYATKMLRGLSATGHREFMDLNMERSVKHNRDLTGKVDQKGMAKKVEYACEVVPNRPTEEATRNELRTGSANAKKGKSKTHEWLNENSPFVIGFELIHNGIQLWHHENEPIIGEDAEKNPIYADPNSFQLPGSESLNSQTPQFFDIGEKIKVKYCQKYYIDTPFRVDWSEKEISMTRILASSVDRKAELNKSIIQATSVIEEELDKTLTKREAYKQLNRTIDELNLLTRTMIIPPAFSSMKKDAAIRELKDHRRRYFKEDAGARDRIEADVRKQFEEKYPPFSDAEKPYDISSNPIYCLSKKVLQQGRYKSNN